LVAQLLPTLAGDVDESAAAARRERKGEAAAGSANEGAAQTRAKADESPRDDSARDAARPEPQQVASAAAAATAAAKARRVPTNGPADTSGNSEDESDDAALAAPEPLRSEAELAPSQPAVRDEPSGELEIPDARPELPDMTSCI
jgi:hypothetical protein